MNSELDISLPAAWEQLRVARQLQNLPVMARQFRTVRLNWSKVRAMTRVATPDIDQALSAAALDLTASGVERLCEQYRWRSGAAAACSIEQDLDRQRMDYHSLTCRRDALGNTVIRICLPPDRAASFMRSLEQAEDALFNEQRLANEKMEKPLNLPKQVELAPSQPPRPNALPATAAW